MNDMPIDRPLWQTLRRLCAGTAVLALLAGCVDGQGPFAAKPAEDAAAGATADGTDAATATAEGAAASAPAVAPAKSVRLVDRDVEAPEVFQTTAQALWDGRPSLGGVWVASPETKDPERVIMRNPANGRFVIGALFKRERDNPGPPLQISSDAADALGILAGQPVQISVTALRREEAPATKPDASAPILDAAETVSAEALPPAEPAAKPAKPAKPAKGAPPATDAAAIASETAAALAPAAQPAAAAKPAASAKRIQIGIFSVEANAKRAAETLTKAGVAAEVRKEQSQGKTYWSVTAAGGSDASGTLTKIKGLGFKDAYLVK